MYCINNTSILLCMAENKKGKIYAVDDEKSVRKALGRILQPQFDS